MRLLDFLPWRSSQTKTQLPGFDPIYYLYWYPDVRFSGYPPLEHYLQHGWKEGRDPSAGFSTLGYLAANPDVVQSGANPLLHYVNFGFAEGRSGHWKVPGTPAAGTIVHASPLKMLPPPAAIETANVTLVQEEASEAKVDEPAGEVDVWGLRARENLAVPPHGWLDYEWLLRSRVWPRIFGSVPTSWWAPEVFQSLGIPTGGKWLSLGCGAGHAEIALARHGSVGEILGMDPSAGAITVANELALAAGVSGKVKFAISEMDFPVFEPNSVDVVHMNMSLHHIHDLEWVFGQIFSALRPGGYFVANEFVGPRRFQWSDTRQKSVVDLLAKMPDRLRRDYRDNSVKKFQPTYSVDWWKAWDPTESVRSDDIIPLLKKIAPDAKVIPYGGNIANLLLENIIHNFKFGKTEDMDWMGQIWAADDKSEADEGSDFVYIVAQKSADGRETRVAQELVADWLKERSASPIN